MRSDMRNLYYDVVIAGCGVAGLYAALNLPEEMSVLMLSKEDLESCDSMLAQGGICVLRDEEDYDSYFEDTMRAGHYENRKESVDIMIRSSRDVITDLLNFGVRFANPLYGLIPLPSYRKKHIRCINYLQFPVQRGLICLDRKSVV